MNGSEPGGSAASGPKSPEDPSGSGRPEPEGDPFAEYLWMENEEDFDRQVEEELQEQEFLDRCFQEMLQEEEERDWFIPARDLPQGAAPLPPRHGLGPPGGHGDIPSKSSLNPDAKEFVPGVKY